MADIVNSIKEQIQKFKDRNLDLSCYTEDKLKEILLDIGYYRLGFYCYYYFDDSTNQFHPGIKISDIVRLYYLDMDLKNILLRYINRIEINFRTKVVYYVSMKYKDDSRWYVNPDFMQEPHVEEFKKNFYTSKFIKDNLTLRKHHLKYDQDEFAPCWKVFEYLSFGSVLTILSNLKDDSVKQIIADKYDIRDLNKFFNLIHTVRLLRNICAHSGVLFDYSLPKSANSIPQITYNKGDRNSLDASMKVIGFFIQSISENRYEDYINEINGLLQKHLTDDLMSSVIRERIKYLD